MLPRSSTGTGSQPGIRLPATALEALRGWAAEGYPHEACGLLIGEPGREGAEAEVIRAVRARNRNAERARDRYDLDPIDQLAAEKAARAEGLEVVGIWHSHPDHPARPSETDREAAWEGWSYVIIAVGSAGPAEVRSWRLDPDKTFVEEEIRS
ncbi:MAG: M67 family metallopeptidase [Planctomycetota bacterium]|nr:M67 family metallopeptidase [Planctomycetota bacterium]